MTAVEALVVVVILAGLYMAYRKFYRRSPPKGDITPTGRTGPDIEPDKTPKNRYL